MKPLYEGHLSKEEIKKIEEETRLTPEEEKEIKNASSKLLRKEYVKEWQKMKGKKKAKEEMELKVLNLILKVDPDLKKKKKEVYDEILLGHKHELSKVMENSFPRVWKKRVELKNKLPC